MIVEPDARFQEERARFHLQDREMSYVQMSRARDEARIYSTEDGETGDDVNMLAQAMERSRKKEFAMDTLRKAFDLRDEQRRPVAPPREEPSQEDKRAVAADEAVGQAERERRERQRAESETQERERHRDSIRRHRGL